ncbi:MAG TPA: hypothetical protein VGG25_27695 [Streptosporangiaceae bacterium]|jgi:hypothetical protein
MRTASLWGAPPTRYYTFLRRLEQAAGHRPVSLAVLGCADGKFVVPAARRGIRVWAVDIDEVTLFGGTKPGADGPVRVPGLAARLAAERLAGLVEITCGDFTGLPQGRCFDGVLTSGALQYSSNTGRDLGQMVAAVGAYVRLSGLLYVDYMLPHEDKYKGRPNCPDASWWKDYFARREEWDVVYNRAMPPTLDRAHLDYPVDHYHQWGHLLARRALAGQAAASLSGTRPGAAGESRPR